MSSHDEVRHRFEWDAANFDAIYEDSAGTNLGRMANRVLRKAIFERYRITFEQAGDVRGKRILDIGCGSGVYAAEFLKRGAGRVVGVDFSQPMLDMARKRAAATGRGDAYEFRLGDFTKLPLEDKFDVCIAMGVFDYLPEPAPFLRKMAERTAGIVLASFPAPSGVRGALRRMRYLLTRRGDVHYYTSDDVDRLARDAGFRSFEKVAIRAPFSGSGWVLVGRT